MTTHELANKVCGEIPDGYEIQLRMENGHGGVVLLGFDGEEIEFDASDLTIDEQIEVALKRAIDDAAEHKDA